jgi:hypothetical protein
MSTFSFRETPGSFKSTSLARSLDSNQLDTLRTLLSIYKAETYGTGSSSTFRTPRKPIRKRFRGRLFRHPRGFRRARYRRRKHPQTSTRLTSVTGTGGTASTAEHSGSASEGDVSSHQSSTFQTISDSSSQSKGVGSVSKTENGALLPDIGLTYVFHFFLQATRSGSSPSSPSHLSGDISTTQFEQFKQFFERLSSDQRLLLEKALKSDDSQSVQPRQESSLTDGRSGDTTGNQAGAEPLFLDDKLGNTSTGSVSSPPRNDPLESSEADDSEEDDEADGDEAREDRDD